MKHLPIAISTMIPTITYSVTSSIDGELHAWRQDKMLQCLCTPIFAVKQNLTEAIEVYFQSH